MHITDAAYHIMISIQLRTTSTKVIGIKMPCGSKISLVRTCCTHVLDVLRRSKMALKVG